MPQPLLMQLPMLRLKLKLPHRPTPLPLLTPLLRPLRPLLHPKLRPRAIMACKRKQNRSVMRLRLMPRESTIRRLLIRKHRPPKLRLLRSRLRARRRLELQRRSLSNLMPRTRKCKPPRRSSRDRSKTLRELLVTPSRKRPERRNFA